MKKYWQLLLIVGVIFTTISVHYIQVANAKKNDYNFTFEKISGDDKYVDSLTIEARIDHGHMGMGHGAVLIKKDESTIVDFSRFNYKPLLYQELIEEHKNFMRGKMLNANNYYEDDSKLIYVKEPQNTWELNEGDTYIYEIDVLDKVKNTKTSFEIESELKHQLNWMTLDNITVVDHELKLLVRHIKNNGDEELYHVIIDLKKQQKLSESLIDAAIGDDTTRNSITPYNLFYNITHEKYHVYSVNSHEAQEYTFISSDYNVFNTETNEVTAIQFPEGLEQKAQSSLVDNNYFIVSYITGTDTLIYRYNIGQQRWLEPITAPHPVKLVNKVLNNTSAQNGKFYVVNEMEKDFVLQIFDIEKGEILYEGILTKENSMEKYNIWVNRIIEHTE